MKKIKLLLVSLPFFLFIGCEDDPLSYPGEKENKELYSVGLSNVLTPGNFLSIYISAMYASEDAKLTKPLAAAMEFSAEHFIEASKYFVPSGSIINGTLATSSEPIGNESTGKVLVYYFSKGSDSLAYQISEIENGYKHQGYQYESGRFQLSFEAEEVLNESSSGSLTDTTNGSTSWSYNGDTLTIIREENLSGESSELVLNMANRNGKMSYYENENLTAETNFLGGAIEGVGGIYDAAGDIIISGEWPIIPVPPGFEDYRIPIFSQDGFYETITTAHPLILENAAGGPLSSWFNIYNEISVAASYMFIPESADIDVTPSELKRTYSYTAKTGESVVYTIQATTPSLEHLVTVDGVDYFKASESRESPNRLTTFERLVSIDSEGEGVAQISVGSSETRFLGRGSRNVPNWYWEVYVSADNSARWNHYFAGGSPPIDLNQVNLVPGRIWTRGLYTADGLSGEFEQWQFTGACCNGLQVYW